MLKPKYRGKVLVALVSRYLYFLSLKMLIQCHTVSNGEDRNSSDQKTQAKLTKQSMVFN